MKVKPWKLLSSIKEKSYKIFDLRIDRAVSPRTGEAHDFYIFESHDWVNIIPVTRDNEVVLIKQYRHGTGDTTVEIPGGIIEPGDTPLDAAIRELREETGYAAKEMVYLGAVHANPAFLNNRCHSFLALNSFPEGPQNLDDKEDIVVVLRSLDDIQDMIRAGEITHSLILAAFYRYYTEYRGGLSTHPPSSL